MKIKTTILGLLIIECITFYSCSKNDKVSQSPNLSLIGTWNFIGMIETNGDTTLTTLNSGCTTPCFTLQISDTSQYNYYAKAAGTAVIATNVRYSGNSIVVPQLNNDAPYIGQDVQRYIDGVQNPQNWMVSNKQLKLTSTSITDTLLFTLN